MRILENESLVLVHRVEPFNGFEMNERDGFVGFTGFTVLIRVVSKTKLRTFIVFSVRYNVAMRCDVRKSIA